MTNFKDLVQFGIAIQWRKKDGTVLGLKLAPYKEGSTEVDWDMTLLLGRRDIEDLLSGAIRKAVLRVSEPLAVSSSSVSSLSPKISPKVKG